MELFKNTAVKFHKNIHCYLMKDADGKNVLLKGVTTLMKERGLSPDYSDVDPETLRKAAERGTAVHKLLEAYDNGESVGETAELKAYRKLGLNVIASEYLISDNICVASSIDKVIYVDEHTVDLGDVKTTYTLHTDSVAWQLSIYKLLFEAANPGIKVRDLYGIHVRNGKAVLVKVEPVPEEDVAELLRCEREGEAYAGNAEPPKADTSAVLSPDETALIVSSALRIEELKNTAKALEEACAAAKEKVLAYMTANHINEMEAGGCTIKLKAAYTTERIDSKRLKEEQPEIYKNYVKQSETKASLIIKN